MKTLKILVPVVMLFIAMCFVSSALTGQYNAPRDGATLTNLTFNCTFSEGLSPLRNITNVSVYSDISGSWARSTIWKADYGGYKNLAIRMNHTLPGDYTWQCIASATGGNKWINQTIKTIANTTTLTYVPLQNKTVMIHNMTGLRLGSGNFSVNPITGVITFTRDAATYKRMYNATLNISYHMAQVNTVLANRSFTFAQIPTVTISSPADSAVKASQSFVEYTVTGSSDKYYCSIWTNESATYLPRSNSLPTNNNTKVNLTYHFSAQDQIKYAVFCSETATSYPQLSDVYKFSANRTLSVDTTLLLITNTSPADGSYSRVFPVSIQVTAVDPNLQSCQFFINNQLNSTNNSMISGRLWAKVIKMPSEAKYNLSFRCNDTAANTRLLNYTIFTVDNSTPKVTKFLNVSNSGYCDRFSINWTTNEASNGSISYGTTVAAASSMIGTSTRSTGHTLPLLFNNTAETKYYVNVTSCDIAGNCNRTNHTVFSPTKLCTGWSEFAYLSDNTMNLSTALNRFNGDYIYNWNASGQVWRSYTSSGANVNAKTSMKYGDVYLLYTSTDETFWRVMTGTGIGSNNYRYNFSIGHNFLAITKLFTFGNLSVIGLNQSISRPHANNFTYFSGWNNTAKNTVDYRYNWTWNNNTKLGRTYNIESVWIWSSQQINWNGTGIGR